MGKNGFHIGFDGRLVKSGSWYAVEIPALLIYSQAKTQRGALEAISRALGELLNDSEVEGFDPRLTQWLDRKELTFRAFLPATQPAIAFMLRQIRGYKAMSLADAQRKLKFKSKNAVAAYEKVGGPEPSIGKLGQFFEAYGVSAYSVVGL